MKTLYRILGDYIEGIFIEEDYYVNIMIEYQFEIIFGDIHGKHSNVHATFSKDDLEIITTDQKVLDLIEKYGLESGHNPLNYAINCEKIIKDYKIDPEKLIKIRYYDLDDGLYFDQARDFAQLIIDYKLASAV